MRSGVHPFLLPELGLGRSEIRISVWLVAVGEEVAAGDRVLEVVSDDVVIDLESPVSGRLVEKCVAEDDLVTPGSQLGVFELIGADAPDASPDPPD